MALYQGISLPLSALRHQIASAVDLIVQIERTIEGRRWVKAIAQVHGLSADGYYQTRVLMTRGEQGELRRIEDRG
jgi:Flp pilus assembly CpaF family ATPase